MSVKSVCQTSQFQKTWTKTNLISDYAYHFVLLEAVITLSFTIVLLCETFGTPGYTWKQLSLATPTSIQLRAVLSS